MKGTYEICEKITSWVKNFKHLKIAPEKHEASSDKKGANCLQTQMLPRNAIKSCWSSSWCAIKFVIAGQYNSYLRHFGIRPRNFEHCSRRSLPLWDSPSLLVSLIPLVSNIAGKNYCWYENACSKTTSCDVSDRLTVKGASVFEGVGNKLKTSCSDHNLEWQRSWSAERDFWKCWLLRKIMFCRLLWQQGEKKLLAVVNIFQENMFGYKKKGTQIW